MVIFLIGGPSGGGKTTLAQSLKSKLESEDITVELIKMDNYYKEKDKANPRTNFDTPEAVDLDLLVKHLEQLYTGKSIKSPVYSFALQDRLAETLTIHPTKAVIVEGIFVLSMAKQLRNAEKLTIYIQPDSYLENIERRAKRDVNERNTTADETKRRELKSFVRDGFFNFIARTRYLADVVISNNTEQDLSMGIDEIMKQYTEKFKQPVEPTESAHTY